MKRINYKDLVLMSLAFFVETSLTCCSDSNSNSDIQPEPTPSPTYLIVGEWLEDLGGNDIISFGVYNYKKDGTCTNYEVNVEKDYDNCYIYNFTGSYTISGTKWSQWKNHPLLGTMKYEPQLQNLTKYDLTYYYEEYKLTGYQHRIISTYNMYVGENKTITIEDNEFVPTKYYSNHERVAIVDDKGLVTAKEIGTAYISVTSSIGTAVIRIVVTDPDNLFCNFSKYLNVNIEDIPLSFGKEYLDVDAYEDVGEDSNIRFRRHYNLYDDLIENVDFYYGNNGKVNSISPTFREGVDTEAITKELSEKFQFLEVLPSGNYRFGQGMRYMSINNGNVEYEDKNLIITWSPTDRTIFYALYDIIDETELQYYDFYKLLGVSLEDVAKYLGNNYSDSYIEEKVNQSGIPVLGGSHRIVGGIRHYPREASDSEISLSFASERNGKFNGYEKVFESIVIAYSASGSVSVGTPLYIPRITYRGPVNSIELTFVNNTDVDMVTKKLSEIYNLNQKLWEEDGSVTWQYLVHPNSINYADWNPINRTLKFYRIRKTTLLY